MVAQVRLAGARYGARGQERRTIRRPGRIERDARLPVQAPSWPGRAHELGRPDPQDRPGLAGQLVNSRHLRAFRYSRSLRPGHLELRVAAAWKEQLDDEPSLAVVRRRSEDAADDGAPGSSSGERRLDEQDVGGRDLGGAAQWPRYRFQFRNLLTASSLAPWAAQARRAATNSRRLADGSSGGARAAHPPWFDRLATGERGNRAGAGFGVVGVFVIGQRAVEPHLGDPNGVARARSFRSNFTLSGFVPYPDAECSVNAGQACRIGRQIA